jgi:ferredoxin-NADP reductase
LKFETQVTTIISRTGDVGSFRFQKPSKLTYTPGQYMLATLKVDGKELVHPFSFSSSPTEAGFIEFTKKFTDSDYSKALKTLKIGDWAKIDAPFGQFTFTGEYPKICMVAGGIGITPLWSICKYCTDTQLNSSIILIYGCHSENEIAFHKELVVTQNKNPNLRVIFVLSQPDNDWKGHSGLIDSDLIKNEVSDYNERVFFACGPPGMMVAIKNVIKSLGLPSTQLKLEAFNDGHN